MKKPTSVWFALVLAMAGHLALAPRLSAVPFSETKIIIEVNATAGDAGIQIFLDAEGWNRLEVSDPFGQPIFDVTGSGSVGMTGVTELYFESAEPSFEDLSLDGLLARFPEGDYKFDGVAVDGRQLNGKAVLKHNIPNGPIIVSPMEDETLSPTFPVTIDWNPVSDPFPGTALPVTIVGYQVIVERVKPRPLLEFQVNLTAEETQVTVPVEFLEEGAEYAFEVLAIDASGNQTISESRFKTTR